MIHVVVSCTERKSVPPLASLRASELTRESFDKRVASWIDRISAAVPTHAATDLYQGEHWAVARELIACNRVEVWVGSAGFGLVNARTRIASYAATFASGQADSITLSPSTAGRNAERSTWWHALQHRTSHGRATSLASLADDGPLIIAASRPYLAAMEQDLLDADSQAGSRLIVSTTGPVPSGLEHLRTPGTGKLRTILGGSMQAISIRLAAKIVQTIDEVDLTHEAAANLTARLMAEAAPLERHSRSPLSDDQVSAYIASALRTDTPPSCTALLRMMRDAGMACEQSRFRRLYQETRATIEQAN